MSGLRVEPIILGRRPTRLGREGAWTILGRAEPKVPGTLVFTILLLSVMLSYIAKIDTDRTTGVETIE